MEELSQRERRGGRTQRPWGSLVRFGFPAEAAQRLHITQPEPLEAVKHMYLPSRAGKCFGTRFLWKTPLGMASSSSAMPVPRDTETVAMENTLTSIPYLLSSQSS